MDIFRYVNAILYFHKPTVDKMVERERFKPRNNFFQVFYTIGNNKMLTLKFMCGKFLINLHVLS